MKNIHRGYHKVAECQEDSAEIFHRQSELLNTFFSRKLSHQWLVMTPLHITVKITLGGEIGKSVSGVLCLPCGALWVDRTLFKRALRFRWDRENSSTIVKAACLLKYCFTHCWKPLHRIIVCSMIWFEANIYLFWWTRTNIYRAKLSRNHEKFTLDTVE